MAQGLPQIVAAQLGIAPDRVGVRQTGFERCRIPGALDLPRVETILHEGGPLGFKRAGEVPILDGPAAVACAVSNAVGGRSRPCR